jgi:hypothetical protein
VLEPCLFSDMTIVLDGVRSSERSGNYLSSLSISHFNPEGHLTTWITAKAFCAPVEHRQGMNQCAPSGVCIAMIAGGATWVRGIRPPGSVTAIAIPAP